MSIEQKKRCLEEIEKDLIAKLEKTKFMLTWKNGFFYFFTLCENCKKILLLKAEEHILIGYMQQPIIRIKCNKCLIPTYINSKLIEKMFLEYHSKPISEWSK